MGKSTFLERDLISAAKLAGYMTPRLNLGPATHTPIKVICAGSSEVTLRQMFGRAREPFYNWAPLTPFRLLGREFVRAVTQLVNGLSRYPLTPERRLVTLQTTVFRFANRRRQSSAW